MNPLKYLWPFGGDSARRKISGQRQIMKSLASPYGLARFLHMNNYLDTSKWDKERFAADGYQANYVAHLAIRDIASNAARVRHYVMEGTGDSEREVENHPVLDLLSQPNPVQSGVEFRKTLFSQFLLYGNGLPLLIGPSGRDGARIRRPLEMWPLPPNRVDVEVDPDRDVPIEYVYHTDRAGQRRYPVREGRNGLETPVMHWKTYNPFDMHWGMPPLMAAAVHADINNEAARWNFNLLKNDMRPSGLLVVPIIPEVNDSGTLTDEQYRKMKREIAEQQQGSESAGNWMLMEGGLDYKQLSINPKDMDWLESLNMSARAVALTLGFPPQLLGIAGDSTYNNQREARLALWTDTVIPLFEDYLDLMNRWLMPLYDSDGVGAGGLSTSSRVRAGAPRLVMDTDSIEAIAERMLAQVETLEKAYWLTLNERRERMGYGPVDGGDELMVPSTMIPLGMSGSAGLGNDSA